MYFTTGKALGKTTFDLTSVLPSALVVLKLLVLPSSLSKHLITLLDWHAAFQKTICLIPGSNLVIWFQSLSSLHGSNRVLTFLTTGLSSFFWHYKTSVGWFSDSGQKPLPEVRLGIWAYNRWRPKFERPTTLAPTQKKKLERPAKNQQVLWGFWNTQNGYQNQRIFK